MHKGLKVALGTALLVTGSFAGAYAESKEEFFRQRLCAGMKQERYLQHARSYVDCVSDTHAVEVEFANKFKQAIGQALHYAEQLKLKPGIILVCVEKDENCLRHGLLTESALAYWRIPATIWKCGPVSLTLADCQRVEIIVTPVATAKAD